MFAACFRAYRKECILGPLFKFFEAVFELFLPLVMAQMIEAGVGRNEGRSALQWFLLLLVLIGLGLFFSFRCQAMAARASQGFGTRLRNQFLEKINRLPLERIEQEGSQHFLNVLTTDINKIQVLVAFSIRLLSRTPFLCIGAVVLSFLVHPQLAGILLALLPILGAILCGISKLAMPQYNRAQETLERCICLLTETFSGLRVIRSFSASERQRLRMEAANAQQCVAASSSALLAGSLSVWTLILLHLAEGVMLVLAGRALGMETLAKPALIALLSYINQILVAMMVLANLAQIFPQAFQSWNRLNKMLDLPEMLEDPQEEALSITQRRQAEKEGRGLSLVVHNLSYSYPGSSEPAIQNVHFSLEPGQSLGIIGGTGSGKTTLLHLLQGYGLPQTGTISIGDQALTEHSRAYWGQYSACVPQKHTILQGTLAAFLQADFSVPSDFSDSSYFSHSDVSALEGGGEERCGNPAGLPHMRSTSKEEIHRIQAALDCAQVDFFHWPEDADRILASGGKNLSGGQKQRLILAQALLQNRPLLILDQACSALDPKTSTRVRAGIEKGKARITRIYASQHVDVVRSLDLILVLQEGRQVGLGSHAELIQNCPEYRNLCRLQLGEEAIPCN